MWHSYLGLESGFWTYSVEPDGRKVQEESGELLQVETSSGLTQSVTRTENENSGEVFLCRKQWCMGGTAQPEKSQIIKPTNDCRTVGCISAAESQGST